MHVVIPFFVLLRTDGDGVDNIALAMPFGGHTLIKLERVKEPRQLKKKRKKCSVVARVLNAVCSPRCHACPKK